MSVARAWAKGVKATLAFAPRNECRARVGQSPENLAVLRKLALTLIQHDRTRTVGVKASRMKAAWDTGYLLPLLGAA